MRRQRLVWRPAEILAVLRGAAAVEFAIVLPLLALLVLGFVDYGVGLWEATMAGSAARAGAYYAVVNGWASTSTSTNDTNIDATATNATTLTVTPSSSLCAFAHWDPRQTPRGWARAT